MSTIIQINILKKIGKRLLCLEDEFDIILPNFPTLKGNEFIFTISFSNAKNYIDDEIEDLIKGLHLIELLYRNKTQNDFGFGSISPTYKILQKLNVTDNKLALELSNWISQTGGNYYI